MALRIVGDPEHLLDVRPTATRVSDARFVLDDERATCWRETTDGRLRAQLWRVHADQVQPERGSVDWCLLLTRGLGQPLAVIQGTLSTTARQRTVVARELASFQYLFSEPTGFNEEYSARLTDAAWCAAHTLHAAVVDPDTWWGSALAGERDDTVLLTWANLAVDSWAEAQEWTAVAGSKALVDTRTEEWMRHNFTSEEAAAWIGDDPARAISATEAAIWQDAGVSIDQARAWAGRTISNGAIRARDGVRLLRAGWTASQADYAMEVLARAPRSTTTGSISDWAKSPLAPARAVAYLGAGMSLVEAKARERTDPVSEQVLAGMALLRGHPLPRA
jgi:hypothetical protein